MKINTELYGFVQSDELEELIEKNQSLREYVDLEAGRMEGQDTAKGCPACGGCGGCSRDGRHRDAAYLTAAVSALFDYYIPDDIKKAFHINTMIFIDE